MENEVSSFISIEMDPCLAREQTTIWIVSGEPWFGFPGLNYRYIGPLFAGPSPSLAPGPRNARSICRTETEQGYRIFLENPNRAR